LGIINDILDFSKIEAGKLDLETRPFDLHRCVSHAAKSLAARAAQKQIELILKMDADVPSRLLGDADRLRQILVNLVGNAIKFTSQGEITIRVAVAHGPPTQSDYTLHFSVRDTGIGIPANKQADIFDAFSQADVSTTRQYGGTGLGLSISSQLVDMMEGKIWLESEVGVGSTFHFTATFPINKQRPEADQNEEPAISLKDFEVLLIDDNQTSRETLYTGLQQRGLRVVAAASSEEAQALYTQFSQRDPSRCALIVDHCPPDADGIELVDNLAASQPEFHPGVILLTSLTRPIPESFSSQHRVISVMQKPALQSEICAALRHWLSNGSAWTTQSLSASPSEAGSTAKATPGLRFLLVEDGVVNRAVFTGLLEREGHHVTSVEDGKAAVETWREFDFDAILMDLQMPVMDGLQATELIRQEEKPSGEHIPIIAITAAAMEGDQARCRTAGMDDYLSKPVDLGQLQRVLASLRAQRGPTSRSRDFNAEESGLNLDIDLPLELDAELNLIPQPALATSHKLKINFAAPISKLNYTTNQQFQLISTLQRETVQRLGELTQAIDGNDAKLLIRAAHSLRSAAALFEAEKVAAIAGEVEEQARSGHIAVARQQFDALRQVTTQMLEQINEWLEQNSTAT
ncbi:MAG: response regulator, partial [Aureliella sp.]